jgi:nucleoside-diphosphate-sugar epimerase
MLFKSIFITGGSGYVGSKLVPHLLGLGYKVTVYDTMFFGNDFLPKKNPNLRILKNDIRNTQALKKNCEGHDVFIHLACISNDASFELDENLSKSINYECFEPMVCAAKDAKIKRFIYASTSSVYGISSSKDIKEDHPLLPITLYNKFKGLCEPILLKHTDKNFEGVIFRPATVCGYAPRQRFDLSVNILTNHAINNKKIKVFGGDQLRPNLHIDDYCDVVECLVEAPSAKIENQIFNVGHQNLSINEIATKVKKIVEQQYPGIESIPLEITESDDKRSYHINSDKIYQILKFKPKRNIETAVKDLCDSFKKNLFNDSLNNEYYFNVKRIKNIKAI